MADESARRKRKWDIPDDSRRDDSRRSDRDRDRERDRDRRDRPRDGDYGRESARERDAVRSSSREYKDYHTRDDRGGDRDRREDFSSRYDRDRDRSRSTTSDHKRHGRSRSRSPDRANASAAAAAAAARINAMIASRGPASPPPTTSTALVAAPSSSTALVQLSYEQDGDFITDIEVNDLKNRYVLTRGATQTQIKQETGADVTTRGKYYPDKSMATEKDPPLYLHITAHSQESMDMAVAKVQDLINQGLPQLIEDRTARRRQQEEEQHKAGIGMQRERRKWPEIHVPIGLEPQRNFNVRAKLVGPGGAYVKHIQSETGTRVQVKGVGSGYYENDTGQEHPEPMFIYISGPDEAQMQRAQKLAQDLIATVHQEYERVAQGRGEKRGKEDRHRRDDYGYQGGYEAAPAADASQDYAAAWAAYYAQYPQAAAEGAQGYDAAAYAAYYGNYDYSQYGQAGAEPQNGQPPPPPPPQSQPPPPPPPSNGSSASSYRNVPPPPGL